MSFRYPSHIRLLRAFCASRWCTVLSLALTIGSNLAFALPKGEVQNNTAPAHTAQNTGSPATAAAQADDIERLIQELSHTDLIPANAAVTDSTGGQDRLLPFLASRLALDVTAAALPGNNTNGLAAETSLFSPAERVFNAALDMLGTRYAWGGNSKQQGFDCSGLVKAVYHRALAVDLPRSAHAQANSSKLIAISRQELTAGDLVFFNTRGKTYSHVGVYLGDRQFMHAPRKGKNVRIDSMGKSYWSKRFTGARRAIAATPTTPDNGGNAGKAISGDRS